MIKEVKLDEIDSVMEIISDAKELLKKDSLQWQQGYPNIETMKNDIINHSLFGYYKEDENNYLVGIIALVYGYNPDYVNIEGNWNYKTGDNDFTIHRIAVRKDYHKKKIGDSLIKFSIEEALKYNIKSIKIDTHIKNIPMQKLAFNNGFIYKGIITLVRDELDNKRLAYELTFDDLLNDLSPCGFNCNNCPLYLATINKDIKKIKEILFLANDYNVDLNKDGCLGCLNKDSHNKMIDSCYIKNCTINKNIDSCSKCNNFICDYLKSNASEKSISNLLKLRDKNVL